MNPVIKVARVVLRCVTAVLAIVMLMYSAYALYDSYYTNKQAFASWDLAQYKPRSAEGGGSSGFEEIQKINQDVAGWITMEGTHIDYPVVQGENDIKYASTDVYGEPNITGAIYLAYQNKKDFSDQYSMIYGHHMDNGAMFGDLDRYTDRAFFEEHTAGFLMTPDRNYRLDVFASVQTDAYDRDIYALLHNNKLEMGELLAVLREKAVMWREPGDVVKIVALSTCFGSETNGRTLVLASAVKTDEIPVTPPDPDTETRTAVGHGKESAWALLNLICVLFTFYAWLPVFSLKRKFGRKRIAEAYIDGREKDGDPDSAELIRGLKSFIRKYNIGLIAEPVIFVLSVIAFVLTENIRTPMTLIDKWTPLMIVLLGLAIAADMLLFVYRGKQPEEAEPSEDSREKILAGKAYFMEKGGGE